MHQSLALTSAPKIIHKLYSTALKIQHRSRTCSRALHHSHGSENRRTTLLTDFSRVLSLEHHSNHWLNLLCQISQPVQVGRPRTQRGYGQKHPPLTSPRTLLMTFYSKVAVFTFQHTPTLCISAGQLRASQQPHLHLLHCLQVPVSPSSLKPAGPSRILTALLTTDRNTDKYLGAC